MRKYDKKNKIYMLMVMISSIILIVIFSFFIKKVITNGSLVYTIDAGSFMYDNDKNLIKIDEDGTLKIKWNDMYYLMYKEQMHSLGKTAVIYNPIKSQMNLYGKYYEVTEEGEDRVIIHEDETIVNLNQSKFYKIADRKYLIIDNVIKSENNELNTSNYLLIELDKKGNAQLYNNAVNLKTIKETNIITSTFTLNIAEEKLIFKDKEIDLKKIIGSSNEYVKAEDIEKEEEKQEEEQNNQPPNNTTGGNNGVDNNAGNGTGADGNNTPTDGNGDGTTTGDGQTTGNGTGGNGGSGGSGGTGSGNTTEEDSEDKKDDDELSDEEIKDIIETTKTTSIISITSSIGYITVDYVIYDPLDEYESVYVEIRNKNNESETPSIIYFDKTSNNLVIPNLKANATYELKFKYFYFDKDGGRVVEEFDKATIMMGSPEVSMRITKISQNRIYYTLYLDKEYNLDKVTVNLDLKAKGENGEEQLGTSKTYTKDELYNKETISGYFDFVVPNDSKIQNSIAKVYLSDIFYDDIKLSMDVSHKVAMP